MHQYLRLPEFNWRDALRKTRVLISCADNVERYFFVKRRTRHFLGEPLAVYQMSLLVFHTTLQFGLPLILSLHAMVAGALISNCSIFFVILWLVLKINLFHVCFFFVCFVLFFCRTMSQQNRTRHRQSSISGYKVLINVILTSFVIVNSLLVLVWDILDVNFAETSPPPKKYNEPTEAQPVFSVCFFRKAW